MSKTFKLNLTFDVKAVLGDELVKDLVERSKAEDAPKFLSSLREGSSDANGVLDEEVFIKAALTGILRGKIKGFAAHLIESAGMTGTVSPIRVRDTDEADA